MNKNSAAKDYEASIFKTHSTRKLSSEGLIRQSEGEETDRYEEMNGTHLEENNLVRDSRRGSIEEDLKNPELMNER